MSVAPGQTQNQLALSSTAITVLTVTAVVTFCYRMLTAADSDENSSTIVAQKLQNIIYVHQVCIVIVQHICCAYILTQSAEF